MEERLVSAAELAGMLGLARGTIYVWNSRGKLPDGLKINGARRWRLSEIREFFGFNK